MGGFVNVSAHITQRKGFSGEFIYLALLTCSCRVIVVVDRKNVELNITSSCLIAWIYLIVFFLCVVVCEYN